MDDPKQSQYQLELLKLPLGNTHYHFDIDRSFFEKIASDEVSDGDISVDLEVRKMADTIEIAIDMVGEVSGVCDRCLGAITLPVDVEETIYVKFGAEFNDEGDDVITVPEEDGVFDISWLLYEYIVLALPVVKVHDEGECDKDMEMIIEQLRPGNKKNEINGNDEVDPRWAALKNILNN